MRIAEYKQIDTREETYTVIIPSEYDEQGNVTVESHEETRIREVPVMGVVYRDMTEDEVVEMEKAKAEIPDEEPTQSDRIEAQVMYTALMTDTLLESEGNENV